MGKLWKAREKAGRNLKKARGLGRAARCAFRSPARSGLIPSWAPLGALGDLLALWGHAWGARGPPGSSWGPLGVFWDASGWIFCGYLEAFGLIFLWCFVRARRREKAEDSWGKRGKSMGR